LPEQNEILSYYSALSFIFQSIPFSKFSQTPKPNIFLIILFLLKFLTKRSYNNNCYNFSFST
ncbi:hypothetical protein K9859_11815, partial [Lactococcus lactis]|nr:hypothetical protein [Lactococcus lactis]